MEHKYLKPQKEYFDKIFDLVYDTVMAKGGNGNGLILCKYYFYKDVIKLFDQYLKTHSSSWHKDEYKELSAITYHLDWSNIIIQQLLNKNVENDVEDVTIIV